MLERFDLNKDPFAIVPNFDVENWAGNKELREELIDIVLGVRSRDVGLSEFVVLHGELGSGKSHALRYLRTYIEKNESEFRSLPIYVERPRVAPELNFLELYKHIITEIGKNEVAMICKEVNRNIEKATTVEAKKVKRKFGPHHNLDTLESIVLDEHKGIRNMLVLLQYGAFNSGEVFDFLTGKTRCPCEEYEGKIDSDFMAAKVLGEFFNAITSKLGNVDSVYESVYLFVDECEILFDAKVTESTPVFSGLRDLIIGVPYGLGIILSFSAATALIEAYMPQHLLKRMTYGFIEIPMLENSEAVSFIQDQLDWFRTENSDHKGTLYPFTNESIGYIVEHQTTLTPRNLLRNCRRVLDRAIRRYDLTPEETISSDIAEEILRHTVMN